MAMTLMEHQKKLLDETKDRNLVAYFMDMGGGKTFIGSEKAVGFKVKILIVCQKSKIQDWIEHFKEHYPIRNYFLMKMECGIKLKINICHLLNIVKMVSKYVINL